MFLGADLIFAHFESIYFTWQWIDWATIIAINLSHLALVTKTNLIGKYLIQFPFPDCSLGFFLFHHFIFFLFFKSESTVESGQVQTEE